MYVFKNSEWILGTVCDDSGCCGRDIEPAGFEWYLSQSFEGSEAEWRAAAQTDKTDEKKL